MLARLRSALYALLDAGRFRGELDEEIAFHLDRLTEDLIGSGLEPDEARRQARLRFGSAEGVHSRSREARGVALLDEAVRNLRFALRGLVRNPHFSVSFVLTLGLCIGAATAVYSVVDAVLWRRLPYPEPDRLALVELHDPERGEPSGIPAVDGAAWERIRDGAAPLARAVFSNWPTGVNLATGKTSAYVRQQRVSAGFFSTLGVAPLVGREFRGGEDVPGGPPVVILSHEIWERIAGGDPRVVGRPVRLKGEPHTVVGVMPAGFRSSFPADVWTPLRPSIGGEGEGANYTVIVRVPRGMSRKDGAALLARIEPTGSSSGEPSSRRFGLVPFERALGAGMRLPLLLLLGATALMLLVGCANLAGLQAARAVVRGPEMATRQALGGSAAAMARQVLIENLLLGLLGGLAGLAFAHAGVGGLEVLVRAHFDTWQEVHLDGRALIAALGLTLLATALFGMGPILQARRVDVRRALAGGGRGIVGGGGARLRQAFLVGQVALVTALLFAAGLLLRSYGRLAGLDPGFEAEGVLTAQISLDDATFAGAEEVDRFFEETLAGIRRLPGVSAAAVALTLPYERSLNMPFRVAGRTDETSPITNVVYVTPGFFQVLGVPLLRGRDLEEADRSKGPPVVVANQAFVESYLREGPAVGARLATAGGEREVVGIVGDVLQANAGWGSPEPVWRSPTLYFPAAQAGDGFLRGIHVWFSPSWLVKTSGSPSDLAMAVTAAIHGVKPDIPVARIASLSEVMSHALARPRFEAAFLAVVATLALLLAVVGLYGVVANEVVERQKEIGLRMALGATPGRVVWSVGRPALRLTLLGLVAGAAGAALLAPWLAHVIWGVLPYDPITLGGVVFCLASVTSAASFLPAARIARLEPARILREE